MNKAILSVLSTLLLLTAGCAGARRPVPEAPPPAPEIKAPQPVPAPQAGLYSLASRTGVPAVDDFLKALAENEIARLLDRYQTVERPCVTDGGNVRCPEGTPAGTPVPAYPVAWCGLDYFAPRQTMQLNMQSTLGNGEYLYAVYRTDRAPGLENTPAAYAVVLGYSLEDNYAPTVYLTAEGRLVLVRSGCGTPDLAAPAGAAMVLAPRTEPDPKKRQQAEAGLGGLVAGEVSQMWLFLRTALGEVDPCSGASGPCAIDTNFASIVDVQIIRCDRLGPESQMNGYAYNEERLGPFFRPYKAACDSLRGARATLGEPADTTAWRERATEARRLLEPAVQYLESHPH